MKTIEESQILVQKALDAMDSTKELDRIVGRRPSAGIQFTGLKGKTLIVDDFEVVETTFDEVTTFRTVFKYKEAGDEGSGHVLSFVPSSFARNLFFDNTGVSLTDTLGGDKTKLDSLVEKLASFKVDDVIDTKEVSAYVSKAADSMGWEEISQTYKEKGLDIPRKYHNELWDKYNGSGDMRKAGLQARAFNQIYKVMLLKVEIAN